MLIERVIYILFVTLCRLKDSALKTNKTELSSIKPTNDEI